MNLQFAIVSFLLLAVSNITTFGKEPATKDAKTAWMPPKYSKVIGYRFRLPSENAKGPVPSGFTLLKKNSVDTALLKRLTIKSTELGAEHIHKLIAAINAKKVTSPAACYDPHHIFVFYSDTGTVVAAVEVCFSCTGIAATPTIAKQRWYRHDYTAIARLTDELGLWLEHRPVKDWISVQTKRP